MVLYCIIISYRIISSHTIQAGSPELAPPTRISGTTKAPRSKAALAFVLT